MRQQSVIRLISTALVFLLLVSCESVSYYGQAARGQISLLMNSRTIENMLKQPDLADTTRNKLQLIQQARKFAAADLRLPVGKNYLNYVELDRPHVVWNVFASPPLSTESRNWCYPVAGCVSYRGYFAEVNADRFADKLIDEGFDVYTGGVDAYSTLGWFNDPVTSAIVARSDHRLAGLIFHELAHQLVYIPGDTRFNESFASFIEREGLRRWLLASGETDLYQQFLQDSIRQQEFVALVTRHRARLAVLYQSDLSEADKLMAKQQIQQDLRNEYQQRRDSWNRGYDGWFDGPLNNAQLATVASYNDLVPAFARLLENSEGNLALFYAVVNEMTRLRPQQRAEMLRSLMPESELTPAPQYVISD
jgi:predicted aminopeptidase